MKEYRQYMIKKYKSFADKAVKTLNMEYAKQANSIRTELIGVRVAYLEIYKILKDLDKSHPFQEVLKVNTFYELIDELKIEADKIQEFLDEE